MYTLAWAGDQVAVEPLPWNRGCSFCRTHTTLSEASHKPFDTQFESSHWELSTGTTFESIALLVVKLMWRSMTLIDITPRTSKSFRCVSNLLKSVTIVFSSSRGAQRSKYLSRSSSLADSEWSRPTQHLIYLVFSWEKKLLGGAKTVFQKCQTFKCGAII